MNDFSFPVSWSFYYCTVSTISNNNNNNKQLYFYLKLSTTTGHFPLPCLLYEYIYLFFILYAISLIFDILHCRKTVLFFSQLSLPQSSLSFQLFRSVSVSVAVSVSVWPLTAVRARKQISVNCLIIHICAGLSWWCHRRNQNKNHLKCSRHVVSLSVICIIFKFCFCHTYWRLIRQFRLGCQVRKRFDFVLPHTALHQFVLFAF